MQALVARGNRIHVIWDFDGVLATRRDHDIAENLCSSLEEYFAYEERLLFFPPETGPWLYPIATHLPHRPHFPPEMYSQDIVSTRSSALAMRTQLFICARNLSVRWMLFVGHQSKAGSYRTILDSFRDDPACHIFCIDDGSRHVDAFRQVSAEMNMSDRTYPVTAPVIRDYTEKKLQEYHRRVMSVSGDRAVRVRDPSDEFRDVIVLPGGFEHFRQTFNEVYSQKHSEGIHEELRQMFVSIHGEVGRGTFETEEELEYAMQDFIVGLHAP